MPRKKFECERYTYGHKPSYGHGKISACQKWHKATITPFGGDHFAIEYNFGVTELLHNHDPHGLISFIEKYGQENARYEPKHRLLSFGVHEGETYLYSFSPTPLVECASLEDLYW